MSYEKYYSNVKRFVKKRMSKQYVNKLQFSEEEMQEIKEIDEFLRNIICTNSTIDIIEVEGKYPRYLCIDIKVSGKNLNDVFVHRFFDVKDFNYKDNLYIAKSIYKIGQNKHCEVFFCTSQLKGKKRSDVCMPARKKDYAVNLSCIYVDLDLPDSLKQLSDEQLLYMFEDDFNELVKQNGVTLVRSGGGIHAYIQIETIDIGNEENYQKWKILNRNIAILMQEWNADIKCISDKVRLLRVPNCTNRKAKYSPQGLKVHFIKKDYRFNTFEDVEQTVDYMLNGGNIGVFERVLDDIILNTESKESMFYELAWEDDIFTDDVKPYNAPAAIINEFKRMEQKEEIEIKSNNEEHIEILSEKYKNQDVNLDNKTCKEEVQGEYFETYAGITGDYNNIPAYFHYNIRDIIFFIINRRSSVGVRNTTIYLCCYVLYFSQGIKDENTIKKHIEKINKYFKPEYTEKELNQCFLYSMKTIYELNVKSTNLNYKTILKHYCPTEEEKKYTIGNYYENGTNKKKEKDKQIRNKNQADFRNRKRIKEGKKKREEQIKEKEDFILNNPDVTVKEFIAKFHCNRGTFFEYKRRLFKKNNTINKYEQAFIDNPKITQDEFKTLTGGSRNTYIRYKKIFNYKK